MKRHVDPLAVLIAEERNVVLAVAGELRLPYAEHADLVQEAVVRTLGALARGRLVVIGEATDQRAAIRSFLRTVARRIVYARRAHQSLEALAFEPMDPNDMMPCYEARSELRALDLSPKALATFQLVAHEGSVPKAALRLRIPAPTLYTRLRALRADARAARRRLK